ncbi:GRIP and coiled-coil domain-containing protein PFC0235w-like isoform X1 [Acyrthosiphon pisum]|uniref:Uncharacterized protein n=2 Tax=Acyrthosiphon pisum TaxID=7029 RepID=A0A8R2AZ59_ACYPI|nr:GRIP and coiled-coil domain-containing protein PFC0235w-like isoform X1 [Acyrthosiphon pisum]|eukprot:XP_008180221.1 PREDICTED: GRIP and coiled-coil domain-containing protein PFC0235w-like isoform X3 [Acyrthosiphon pisum]
MYRLTYDKKIKCLNLKHISRFWIYYAIPPRADSVFAISYFFIKRRYTQSSIVYRNSTEESDVYGSSDNLFNKSSSTESLNLDQEKKMVDINNVTRRSGYGSTEDEMQESKNYTTTQDDSDNCKLNSDSHSSNMSWESCREGISHAELGFVHSEICQPLNQYTMDKKNETRTQKITRTFFTDRKHKSIKAIQKKTPEKYLVTKMNEDYDQHTLNNDKLEYHLDNTEHELKHGNNLENTKLSSTYRYELKYEYDLDNTKYELKNKNKLEITKISSIHHDELKDEYSLDNTEHKLRDAHNLEITKLSSTYQDEFKDKYNLDTTEHELKHENKLEITNLSSTYQNKLENEYSLDNTEHKLRDAHNLEITKLSSTYQDEFKDKYNLDNTEHELKHENKLEITNLSSTYQNKLENECNLDNTEQELKDDNSLEISEISSIHHDELENKYSLNNREHSSNDDHVMLANVLETTGLSQIHQDEQNCDYNFLTSPLSSLNNDKSISGIDSPNIKFHHDEIQDISGCCNTCSSECTESLPSPIFNNDSSIDDIQYVEDYSDIIFFDPTLSDDAMNEAFVVVEDI